MTSTDFSTFLQEKIAERGWSVRKVSDLTGISPAHLEHLMRGEWQELPAAPYLHGYVTKLGEALGFDPEPYWQALQASRGAGLSRSGMADTMPTNRFARVRTGRWAWLGLVGVIILVYLVIRFAAILGVPTLTIDVPAHDGESTTTQVVTLRGILRNGTTVKVNGEVIPLAADGSWQKTVTLSATDGGLNKFDFAAEKFLGRSTSMERTIIYIPIVLPIDTTTMSTGATSTLPAGGSAGNGTSSLNSSGSRPTTRGAGARNATTVIF